MVKEIKFGWLDRTVTDFYREQMRNGTPLNNDYYYIQYKDGSVVVFDRGYDEDKLPSLNIRNILYISTWFAGEAYGFAECFINPNLPHDTVQDIIDNELYDEDGNILYPKIIFRSDFPCDDYEF